MKTIKPLTDEQIISEVVRIVKKYLPDVRIILFGSRAVIDQTQILILQ